MEREANSHTVHRRGHENSVYNEAYFIVYHYWLLQDFREKNSDLVRQEIVGVLKKSSMAFVRELMGECMPFCILSVLQ